jgi:protein-tyrosine kinase
MERIQAAIQKAKERRGEGGALPPRMTTPIGSGGRSTRAAPMPAGPGPAWAEIGFCDPDPAHMSAERIVTFTDTDPSHVSFDMLRTKILRTMGQNSWTTLGVTSPTSDCGKTTMAVNLAFSFAHQAEIRTVIVDLDLRRPAVARVLGLKEPQSMASVMQGTRPVAENFVRIGDNLAVGTNVTPLRGSSELLAGPQAAQGAAAIRTAFAPHILIYDLPPMLVSDDVMAFVPHLDCVLLVAAAERTRVDEVDKCERDLAEQTNVLGVVLNKCRYTGEEYGYY